MSTAKPAPCTMAAVREVERVHGQFVEAFAFMGCDGNRTHRTFELLSSVFDAYKQRAQDVPDDQAEHYGSDVFNEVKNTMVRLLRKYRGGQQ